MQYTQLGDLERLFLALSDKTRMRLLALMNGSEVSVGYLADALQQSQPKISRHLAYLRNSGLVTTRREGKSIYYGINSHIPAPVYGLLSQTLDLLNGDTAPRQLSAQTRAPFSSEEAEHKQYVTATEPEVEEYDDWRPAELDIFLL